MKNLRVFFYFIAALDGRLFWNKVWNVRIQLDLPIIQITQKRNSQRIAQFDCRLWCPLLINWVRLHQFVCKVKYFKILVTSNWFMFMCTLYLLNYLVYTSKKCFIILYEFEHHLINVDKVLSISIQFINIHAIYLWDLFW